MKNEDLIKELKMRINDLENAIPSHWEIRSKQYILDETSEVVWTDRMGNKKITIQGHRIYFSGEEDYTTNGQLNSVDGQWSRKLCDGTTQWHENGKLHRINGPAVINKNGSKEFWRDGVQVMSSSIVECLCDFVGEKMKVTY